MRHSPRAGRRAAVCDHGAPARCGARIRGARREPAPRAGARRGGRAGHGACARAGDRQRDHQSSWRRRAAVERARTRSRRQRVARSATSAVA